MTQIPIGLIASFILVPMFFICILVGYVAHAYTEKAEAFLSNSRIVVDTRSMYSQAGLSGKIMRTGMLTMALVFKNACIKKGLLDSDEVKRFPNDLKRLLFISWGLHCFAVTALIVSGIYAELVEPWFFVQ